MAASASCRFCQIASHANYVVFEDDLSIAFLDYRPLFMGHTLLIPKAHHETLPDLPKELLGPFFANVQLLARAVEQAMEAEGSRQPERSSFACAHCAAPQEGRPAWLFLASPGVSRRRAYAASPGCHSSGRSPHHWSFLAKQPKAQVMPRILLLILLAATVHAADQERVVTSILPSLDYGTSCWSSVTLNNLGDRDVTVEIEAHRAGGGLIGLAGLDESVLHLKPGERVSHRLEVTDEAGVGWLKVRERISSPQLSPVVAISGLSECTVDNQLRSTPRELSYPTRNPWFSGDVEEMQENMISIVNTSERAAQASLCYSAGNLYSVPTPAHPTPELTLVCSKAFQVLIPPYAARQFPVQRDNSTHFAIKTMGDAIVLEMLRPLATGVKVYTVDSTVKFGGEFSADK
jgi:hypothetical protein